MKRYGEKRITLEPQHYLWRASQHHKVDPTKPASNWNTVWRALRDAAGLPGLRFHDLRHGAFVARTYLADLRSGATVDRQLADQLVLFAALAHGRSGYVVPQVTDHVLSNVWLVSQFGATVSMACKSVTGDGINLKRRVVP